MYRKLVWIVMATGALSVVSAVHSAEEEKAVPPIKEATKAEKADPRRKPWHDHWWTNHHRFLVTRQNKEKEGKEWYLEVTKEEKADPRRKPWHDHWWTNRHRFLVTRQDKRKQGKEWSKEPPKEVKPDPKKP